MKIDKQGFFKNAFVFYSRYMMINVRHETCVQNMNA